MGLVNGPISFSQDVILLRSVINELQLSMVTTKWWEWTAYKQARYELQCL
jgi:hypothetical protein